MHFKSKIDGWFKAVLWLSIAVMVITLVLIPQEEYLIGFGVGIPMICLLIWIYFGSYFELRDKYLLCRIGPFSQRIYYDTVTSIKAGKGIMMSMALSKDYVEIRQSSKGSLLGTTYVSPVRREEFIAELKKRCSH